MYAAPEQKFLSVVVAEIGRHLQEVIVGLIRILVVNSGMPA